MVEADDDARYSYNGNYALTPRDTIDPVTGHESYSKSAV